MAGIARMGVEQAYGNWTMRTGRIRLLNRYFILSLIYRLLNVMDPWPPASGITFEAEDLEFEP